MLLWYVGLQGVAALFVEGAALMRVSLVLQWGGDRWECTDDLPLLVLEEALELVSLRKCVSDMACVGLGLGSGSRCKVCCWGHLGTRAWVDGSERASRDLHGLIRYRAQEFSD